MRKLISSILMTLDGRIDHTVMLADDELHQESVNELDEVDTVLFGRVTYELFADAWPAMAQDPATEGSVLAYAHKINRIKKIVFSNTLKSAEWNNATLLKGDAAEHLAQLKQQPGGDMVIAASPRLTQSLMPSGLIDEYRLLLNPLVIGSGARFFAQGARLDLRLVDTKRFNSGIIALTYQKKVE